MLRGRDHVLRSWSAVMAGTGYIQFFLPDVRVCHRVGMRRSRPATETPARRFVRRGWGRLRTGVPRPIRRAVDRAIDFRRPSPAQRERLDHHFAYWRQKWGFDPLNPDLAAIQSHYGETEICWALDPERRGAGEAIAARYESTERVGP